MFSKKATKIDEILTVDLTLCNKCQIEGEDFVNFSDHLRKHKLTSAQLRSYRVFDQNVPHKRYLNAPYLNSY